MYLSLSTDTTVAGLELKAAADGALQAFLQTLGDDERAALKEAAYDLSFEYDGDAADAVFAEYQLEGDTVLAPFQQVAIYNVRDELGHRPVRDVRAEDAHTAHIHAYLVQRRNAALVSASKRKSNARRYHDIAALCLGKDGSPLGRSPLATAHLKAKAATKKQAFAAARLTAAQERKATRMMASQGITAEQAVALVK